MDTPNSPLDFRTPFTNIVEEYAQYTDLYQGNHELIEKSTSFSSDATAEHLKILKERFGYSSFRPLQWTIINAIMNEKRDVCAVLAPGYGRSLCYQYPAVCTDGSVLVISPLVRKVEEEVLSMTISNVSALCLSNCWDTCDKSSVEEGLKENCSIVYINSDVFLSYEESPLKFIDFKLIVIDEAHCVSEWGHEFRVVYKEIQKVRNMFPNPPLLALTSSPSPPVRDDIISHFNMSDPLIVCSSFDRPNLKFEVLLSAETYISSLLRMLHTNPADWKTLFNESTIIYVDYRWSVNLVVKELERSGVPCEECHGGLTVLRRDYAIERFMYNEIKVLVTTVSYGLSIRKPDIRNIIHMNCPKDIENYYQEIGIGGRDGLPTRCIVFCAPLHDIPSYVKDVVSQTSYQITHRKVQLIKLMSFFLRTTACRAQFLWHFDGTTPIVFDPKFNCCDNCSYEVIRNDRSLYKNLGLDECGKYDVKMYVLKYLKAVQKYGFIESIDSIAFQLAAAGRDCTGEKMALYKSTRWWHGIGQLLTENDYIESFFLRDYELSTPSGIKAKGQELLHSNISFLKHKKMRATPNFLMYKSLLYRYTPRKVAPPNEPEPFHQLLLKKRMELARLCGCAYFTVAPNEVIETLSVVKPTSFAALQELDLNGFNKRKMEVFGRDFLRLILGNLDDSWFTFCSKIKSGVDFYDARKKCISVQMAFEFVAAGIRNGFEFEWSKFGITDEMKRKVNDVASQFGDMFLSTIPDWNASEDFKRYASLDMETGQILLILTYLEHVHKLKLEFTREDSKMSMAEALFKYSVPVTIPSGEWYFLSELALNSRDVTRISRIKNIPANLIWECIAIALMKGHEIKLSDYYLNIHDYKDENKAFRMLDAMEFKEVPNITRAKELFRRCSFFHLGMRSLSCGHALLLWSYLFIRIHLYSLNVKFYDFDPPGEQLKLRMEQYSSKEFKKREKDEETNCKRNSDCVDNTTKLNTKFENFECGEDVCMYDETTENAKEVPATHEGISLKEKEKEANNEQSNDCKKTEDCESNMNNEIKSLENVEDVHRMNVDIIEEEVPDMHAVLMNGEENSANLKECHNEKMMED